MVSNIFYFHPYLGKIPILTNIFQMGWFNHQPIIELIVVWFFVFFCLDLPPPGGNLSDRSLPRVGPLEDSIMTTGRISDGAGGWNGESPTSPTFFGGFETHGKLPSTYEVCTWSVAFSASFATLAAWNGMQNPEKRNQYGNGAMPMRRSTSIIYHGWLPEDATSIDTISQQ